MIAISVAALTALCLDLVVGRSLRCSRKIATRSFDRRSSTRMPLSQGRLGRQVWLSKSKRGPRLNDSAARQVVIISFGLIVTVLIVGFVATAVAATSLVAHRHWSRRQLARRSKAEIERCVPEVFDLMASLLRAGLSPVLATAQLAPIAPLPVRDVFRRITNQHEHGERFADLLTGLGGEVPPLRPLCETLSRAERYGDPLGPIIDRLSDESRQRRRRAAEASARQLPVRLCFPLVCCTLPAFVLLTIVPLVAGALSSLRQSF